MSVNFSPELCPPSFFFLLFSLTRIRPLSTFSSGPKQSYSFPLENHVRASALSARAQPARPSLASRCREREKSKDTGADGIARLHNPRYCSPGPTGLTGGLGPPPGMEGEGGRERERERGYLPLNRPYSLSDCLRGQSVELDVLLSTTVRACVCVCVWNVLRVGARARTCLPRDIV